MFLHEVLTIPTFLGPFTMIQLKFS